MNETIDIYEYMKIKDDQVLNALIKVESVSVQYCVVEQGRYCSEV